VRKVYTKKNKHKINKWYRKYYLDNKTLIKNRCAIYVKKRLKIDPNFKLATILRIRLHEAIKNSQKKGSAVRDLGCSIAFLKSYIESKFRPGMTWSNWGNGKRKWNIDHIKPLSKFDLTDRKQLLKAVNYENLQPLWYVDNLSKCNK
jgi:hypothetical protein